MSRVLIGVLACAIAGAAMAGAPTPTEDDAWLDRKAEGWFWYKSLPEPDQPETKEPKTAPSPPPPPKAAQQETPLPAPPPLSVAWVRENITLYLDAAIDDPTPENVAAFLYLQRYAMDKSFAFMTAVQDVTLGNPALDAINRRPTATFANQKFDHRATENQQTLLDKISSTAGLFFFMDGSSASAAQDQAVTMLESNYRIATVRISVGAMPHELAGAGIRPNKGHAEQMGVTAVPALVLLRGDGVFDVVSQAPVSYSDLQYRLLIGAKRLGIVSEEEFNSTRMINAPAPTLAATPPAAQPSALTIPPAQIIQAFDGGR